MVHGSEPPLLPDSWFDQLLEAQVVMGSWPWFFISFYKVFLFILMINLAFCNIFKSDLYVTNIELWAPIGRYSFIVQASISRGPLVHVHSRICLGMIFNSFKGILLILMLCFFIFFQSHLGVNFYHIHVLIILLHLFHI